MTALLTTNIHTPDDVVLRYMELMEKGSEEIVQKFYHAGFIANKTARLGISMPLHPAAKKYFEQNQKQSESSSGEKEDLAGETGAELGQ